MFSSRPTPETSPSWRTQLNRRAWLQFGAGLAASSLFAPWQLIEAAEIAPSLKITAVKTFHLKHRLKRPFGASISVPLSAFREALLVKIVTDAGLVGWGETAPISGARGMIDDQLAPRLIGRNPLEYRKLWRDLWGANFGNGLAQGAVETALNDLRGKALGLPVSELFGGRLRDRVPVYVSALNYVEGREIEDEYPAVAAEMVKRGHKAIKMRVGRYPIEREAAVAAKVREAVGPEVRLMADGNGAYTLGNALRMGHALHELKFDFFEEPLPQSPRYAGYEELRQKLPLPLAGGEVIDSRGTAKDLIDRRAMDIIQPDLSLAGGLGEVLFIAEMAALGGIGCIPHCWGGDILIAASAHLLSLLPDPHFGLPTDTTRLELDQSENPWRDGLATKPLEVKDGFLTVPTKPGLGIEINEDLVRRDAI
jgi:D-galactarolactone cycloisomerase